MKNLTQRLKVFLLLLSGLFVLSGSMKADTFTNGAKLYLKLNDNWSQAGAIFKAYFASNSNGEGVWFSAVSGQDKLYEVTIPGNDFDVVHISRHNPSGDNGQWNYLSSIPAKSGFNQITLNGGFWDGVNTGYEWSNYSAGGGGDDPVNPPASDDLSDLTKYYLRGIDNKWDDSAPKFNAEGKYVATFSAAPSFKLYNGARSDNNGYFPGDACNYSSGISASGDNYTLSNFSGTHQVTFTLTLDSNNKPTLTASWNSGGGGSEVPERPAQLYVNVTLSDGTSYPVLMRLSDNGLQYHGLVTGIAPGDYFNFNFRENENDWSGYTLYPNNTNTPASDQKIDNYTYNGGAPSGNWKYTLAGDLEKNIILRVNLTDLDNPLLKIETINPTGHEYYLHAGFLGNWDKKQRVKFEQYIPTKPTELRAVAIYKEANAGNFGFKITDMADADNGNWYSAGTTLENGQVFEAFNQLGENSRDFGSTANTLLDESALFKTVTFYLTLDGDGNVVSLKPEWFGEAVAVTDDMPVFPIGVYTEDGLKRYDQWPVMYLQARVLNNNRITPEYQFTQVTPDRYELELTMRNTKMRNAMTKPEYDNYGTVVTVKGFDDASSSVKTFVDYGSFTIPGKSHSTDGARYKAICERQTDGTWKLTFEHIGEINDMPFLSMVSGGWIQREECKTLNKNAAGGDQTTSNGWQESWIQYDSRGNILRDRKGQVMYNTMWPPRNPILFKTSFKLNPADKNEQPKDFTLSSKDLTFVKAGTMTGKEWKEYFKKPENGGYNNTDLRYTSNEGEPWNFNAPREYEKLLALDNNTSYTLYRVKNMWINSSESPWDYDQEGKSGKKPYGTKIWSGWMGDINNDSDDDDKQAIWCNHSNWGHVDGVIGKLGYLTDIKPMSSEPLYNDQGDMAFEKPTFFKYVNFFYDNSKPQTVGHSVLFTELEIGGAQIAAMSTKNPNPNIPDTEDRTDYEVGNFQPALTMIDPTIKDYKVTKVEISSYMTTTNNGQEKEELVTRVFNWSGTTPIEDFYKLFASQNGNTELPGDGSYVNNGSYGESNAKWVLDGYDYNSGDYFYKMKVTIVDSNNVAHPIDVKSNPFTILKPEALTLNVYQLVKIGDDSDDTSTDVVTSEYYTYKGSEGNVAEPTLPAYKITIVNDSKFDPTNAGDRPVYDANGNLISGYIDDTNFEFSYEALDVLPDYSTNCRFTDKVLIVGSVPSANNVKGYAYGFGNAAETPANGPQRIAITEEYDRSCQRADNGDRFMHVTNIGNFDPREFSLKMQYSNMVLDGESGNYVEKNGTTEAVTAKYVAIVPEPVLKEAKVDVFYGKDLDSDGTVDVADFEYMGLPLTEAHYHSLRDHIEVEMPNVSDFLKERMVKENFFSIGMDTKADPNRPDYVEWHNVFDFNGADKPYFTDGEDVENNDPNNNVKLIHGEFLSPKWFNYDRSLELIYSAEDPNETDPANYKYNYYPRWKPGMVKMLEMTEYPPVAMAHSISDAEIYLTEPGKHEDGRHFIVSFKINIGHDKDYDPEDSDSYGEEAHNYLTSTYQKSDKDGNLMFDETTGEPIMETEKTHLHHHGENDYYYVTIVDQKNDNAIIADADGEDCKYVWNTTSMMNGATRPVTITKDYGCVDSGKDADGNLILDWSKYNACMAEATKKVDGKTVPTYPEQLAVHVSYLYPFQNTAKVEAPASKPGMNRVLADYDTSSNVVKSQANVGTFAAALPPITTSVEGLESEIPGYVKSGAGFIEVEGNGVQIFNAAGVVVGEGEGHHDVDNGVYVVRYNGRTVKVVVR